VTNPENQHYESIIFQRANQAVISDAVFPELAQGTLKSLADLTGIVELFHSLAEKIQDPTGHRFVELP
jgi:hypothetical protein